MNDPVLSHLVWARRRERSLLYRLLCRPEPLLAAGVGDCVETVWARATVRSQHELVRREPREAPASMAGEIRWVLQASPTPPAPGQFEDREERYDLGPTRQTNACGTCEGAGRVRCAGCDGTGRTFCKKGPSCPRCRAGDKVRCLECEGEGARTCRRCRGEGRIIDWEVEIWTWTVREQRVEVPAVPAPSGRLRRAEARLARRTQDVASAFDAPDLRTRLWTVGSDACDVLKTARRETARAEARAGSLCGRCLHTQVERWLLPVRWLTSRSAGLGLRHLLLGGGKPVEVAPWPRPDPRKILGWLLLVLVGTLAQLARGLEDAAPQVALGTLSAALALPCLWGVVMGRRSTPVIVVVSSDGPTRLLPLIAHAGVLLGRLAVPDDLESALLAGLRGEDEHACSAALVVALRDGRRLRLVEVRGERRLSPADWGAVLGAAAGVVLVAGTGESPLSEPLRRAAALRLPVSTCPAGAAGLATLANDWLSTHGANAQVAFDTAWDPVRALLAAWSKEGG